MLPGLLNHHRGGDIMPMGKGTYGSKKGRPPLSAKQKKLPASLKKKIMASKKK
jgi:hypothetical protein